MLFMLLSVRCRIACVVLSFIVTVKHCAFVFVFWCQVFQSDLDGEQRTERAAIAMATRNLDGVSALVVHVIGVYMYNMSMSGERGELFFITINCKCFEY